MKTAPCHVHVGNIGVFVIGVHMLVGEHQWWFTNASRAVRPFSLKCRYNLTTALYIVGLVYWCMCYFVLSSNISTWIGHLIIDYVQGLVKHTAPTMYGLLVVDKFCFINLHPFRSQQFDDSRHRRNDSFCMCRYIQGNAHFWPRLQFRPTSWGNEHFGMTSKNANTSILGIFSVHWSSGDFQLSMLAGVTFLRNIAVDKRQPKIQSKPSCRSSLHELFPWGHCLSSPPVRLAVAFKSPFSRMRCPAGWRSRLTSGSRIPLRCRNGSFRASRRSGVR